MSDELELRPGLPEVFTRGQAHDHRIADSTLTRWVADGKVQRLARGTYAVSLRGAGLQPAALFSASRHVAAARAALHRNASGFVVSHLSAAAVYGLPLPLGDPGPVHLTAVHALQRSRIDPLVVIHHADSTPTPLTEQDGTVVTTVARTVADCLRTRGTRVSVPIADAALHRGLVSIEEVESELDRQRRWRGRPRAMAALAVVSFTSTSGASSCLSRR